MIIEICANSYQSALNAEAAGASRIEICSELFVGGVTPSYGLIKQVVKSISISVFVLIRPRSGNFTYSEEEFEIMKQDIQISKDLGCHGIVSGVLNEDNAVDLMRTNELVKLSKPLPFTFHRAFDCVLKPHEALEELINLRVDRILTSGQETSAEKGLNLLQELKDKAKGRITILPGSGINSENVLAFKKAGFSEIHTSASKVINSKNDSIYFGNTIQTESNIEVIKAILKKVKDEI